MHPGINHPGWEYRKDDNFGLALVLSNKNHVEAINTKFLLIASTCMVCVRIFTDDLKEGLEPYGWKVKRVTLRTTQSK